MIGADVVYDVVVVGGGNAALTAAITAGTGRRTRHRAGSGAAGLQRRQQPTHAQSSLRTRGSIRRRHGRVSRRRVPVGPPSRE